MPHEYIELCRFKSAIAILAPLTRLVIPIKIKML
jgi:hypothetical protein